MIINKTPFYAKVWEIKPAEKYIDLRISTSEKNEDGDYINSSWFCRALGHAKNSLANLKEKDKITVTSSKFTNEYNREKSTTKA